MLSIPCPFCGPREETEFRLGGPAGLIRPDPTDQASDAEWSAYLFERRNPRGAHRERWTHAGGCGLWFVITRDTLTHAIGEPQSISGDPT